MAHARGQLARFLRLPHGHPPAPPPAGSKGPVAGDGRLAAGALAGPSQAQRGQPQAELHDSFSSSRPPHGGQAEAWQGAGSPAPDVTGREELGRATWTLLHTLAAQFPDTPTRQQQKDARTLVELMTRIYPCAECAEHFKEVVRSMPPEVSSGDALRQWMCRAHNVVNRSLAKPAFNCALVEARWGALDCGEEAACDLSLGKLRRRRWGALDCAEEAACDLSLGKLRRR